MAAQMRKRPAACEIPLQERPGKKPHVDAKTGEVELEVSLAVSGKILAKIRMPVLSRVADLKEVLKEHTKPGEMIQGLLKGEAVLEEDVSLEASGLGSGGQVQVVFGCKPTLFVTDPAEDFELFGSDNESEGEDDDEVPHQNISDAPAVAREVARAMTAAAPDLITVVDRFSWDGADTRNLQAVVIAHPGNDAKKACLQALKIPKKLSDLEDSDSDCDSEAPLVWRCAEHKLRDWSKTLSCGFWKEGQDLEPETEHGRETRSAVTKVMRENLDRHFSFGFNERFINAIMKGPEFHGGYASDGNIVGVLAVRTYR